MAEPKSGDDAEQLAKEVAPAVKDILAGRWEKAVPIVAGLIATSLSGNPVLGAAVAGATELGLDRLVSQSATKRLLAAGVAIEQEREALVQTHLLDVLAALRAGDMPGLKSLVATALDEATAIQNEQFLQIVRLVDRGFAVLARNVDNVGEKVDKGIDAVMAQLLAMQRGPSAGAHDDINEAALALQSGELAAARALLERLRQARRWGTFDEQQRCRVLTLLGDCELRCGNQEIAARLLIEAAAISPDDEHAVVNSALAHLILDQYETAARIADAAMERFPLSGDARAARLQCASEEELPALVKAIPPALRGHAEVSVVVAARVMELREADRLLVVRQAVDVAPTDPRSWNLFGGYVLACEIDKVAPNKPPGESPIDESALAEAESAFAAALSLARKRGDAINTVNALVGRATVRTYLGQRDAAESDLVDASGLQVSDSRVALARGQLLQERGEQKAAVREFRRALESRPSDDLRFALAGTLWSRNDGGDREEATEICLVLAASARPYASVSLQLAVDGLLEGSRSVEAANLVDAASCDPTLKSVLRSRVAAGAGRSAEAEREVLAALGSCTPGTTREVLFALARQLGRFGQHVKAFDIWERLARAEEAQSVGNLIECGMRLGRYGVVLEQCRALRLSGASNQQFLAWEIWILQRYEPRAALALLQELQNAQPLNTDYAFQIAVLATGFGDVNLVTTQLDRLPPVEIVDVDRGPDVVKILLGAGRATLAAQYAYDLLRRYFGSSSVHLAFVHATLLADQAKGESPDDVETARAGSAVCFVEQGNPGERWLVLEDSTVQRGADVPDEVSAGSEQAACFLGARVGDTVVLATAPGQDRTATVLHIIDKVTRRVQDVVSQFQLRFNEPGVWQYQLGPKDEANPAAEFAPIFKMAAAQAENAKEAEVAFGSQSLTLFGFGRRVGVDELDALLRVVNHDGLDLHCCVGSRQEFDDALAAFTVATDIVLDVSALAAIMMLGEHHGLAKLGKRFLVAEGTMAAFRQTASRGNDVFTTSLPPGLIEAPSSRTNVDRMRIREWIEANASVVGCLALASVEPEKRELCLKVSGQAGVESIVLASDESRVLWSDDGVTGVVAREFGTRRVWTSFVLTMLLRAGTLSQAQHCDATARLVGWKYVFTPVDPHVFARAGELSGWRAEHSPLKQALEYLSSPTITSEYAVVLGVSLVVSAYGNALLLSLRDATLIHVMEGLLRRDDGRHCVERAAPLVTQSFGLNVVGKRDAARAIAMWRASSHPLG